MTHRTVMLRHYGSPFFDARRFHPVRDDWRALNKPRGGLWTSPVDAEKGWSWYCRTRDRPGMMFRDLTVFFDLRFNGRMLVIDALKDLRTMRWERAEPLLNYRKPLFEPMARDGVDAVHLTWAGQVATRLHWPRNLYGWDCETVLVLNPNCIKQTPRTWMEGLP